MVLTPPERQRGGHAIPARVALLSDQFRPCDTAVAAAGKRADTVAACLSIEAVKPMLALEGWLTLRPGRHPEHTPWDAGPEAGVHHDPTLGPAGSPLVYGHIFAVSGLLVTHKA